MNCLQPFLQACAPQTAPIITGYVSRVSNVDTDRKRELAEKVVDLTVMSRVRSFANLNGVPDADMTEKLRSRMRQEQTELYIKHFEPEQLLALLDFYNTEIGQSILESQKKVSDELAAGTRIVSGEVK